MSTDGDKVLIDRELLQELLWGYEIYYVSDPTSNPKKMKDTMWRTKEILKND